MSKSTTVPNVVSNEITTTQQEVDSTTISSINNKAATTTTTNNKASSSSTTIAAAAGGGGGGGGGEPHRIYWQQWILSAAANNANSSANVVEPRLSRRELITSSAAVRLSKSAKAQDVTALLRKTLQLTTTSTNITDSKKKKDDKNNNNNDNTTTTEDKDRLVLVGTLYSVPKDYVEFEHELIQKVENEQQQQQQNNDNTTSAFNNSTSNLLMSNNSSSSSYRSAGDPVHIVKTILPEQKPLILRDMMETYLTEFLERANAETLERKMANTSPTDPTQFSSRASSSRTIISPKLQWYYIPYLEGSNGSDNNTSLIHTSSLIPNCVELDGYCTDMDEEDSDDEQEEDTTKECSANRLFFTDIQEEDNTMMTDTEYLQSLFPWLNGNKTTTSIEVGEDNNGQSEHGKANIKKDGKYNKNNNNNMHSTRSIHENILRDEFLHCCKDNNNNKISDYLLKQDEKDKNVWRRMYCVVADDYLWYVTRLYTYKTGKESIYRYAKHGRIRLTRALLMTEPTTGHGPLFRTPYAFEIVADDGTSHIFRASCKQNQIKWMTIISDNIIQSYENNLIKNAELIITDECKARNRRLISSAVEPLWDIITTNNQINDNDEECKNNNNNACIIGTHIGAVLRWGIDVSDYKESCRYIHSVLPAKSPVVVESKIPLRRRFFSSSPSKDKSTGQQSTESNNNSIINNRTGKPDVIDPAVNEMIQNTWEQACSLLARATHIALTFQPPNEDDNDDEPLKLSHSVDTQCRHIEYIITGRFRHGKEHTTTPTSTMPSPIPVLLRQRTRSTDNDLHQEDAPPIDLFEHLLAELQILAVAADKRRAISTSNQQ